METDKRAHRPWQNIAMGNITRVVPVTFDRDGEFTDERGFFIRCGSGGVLKYCPVGNEDGEYIEKTVEATAYFIDPEICRKIFQVTGSPEGASDIYVGYGV